MRRPRSIRPRSRGAWSIHKGVAIPGATVSVVSTANFDGHVEFIPRNAGTGSDFFTVGLRVSRAFRLSSGRRIEGLVEAFNVTDRVNPITRNTTFGAGSYPSNPVSSINTVTAVGDPRTVQLVVRVTF